MDRCDLDGDGFGMIKSANGDYVLLLTVTANRSISPYGGFMGGSVLKDAKTGHYFIQIYWNGKPERFYRFELDGKWEPFTSKATATKFLGAMQRQVDSEIFEPAKTPATT